MDEWHLSKGLVGPFDMMVVVIIAYDMEAKGP